MEINLNQIRFSLISYKRLMEQRKYKKEETNDDTDTFNK